MMNVLNRRTVLALTISGLLSAPPAFGDAQSSHDFTFTAIEGEPLHMKAYAGKAVLLVNTASRCGFTGQYEGLQSLYDAYKDKGLIVLGIPSNDFRQELASAEKVKEFCEMTYGIDFPMTDIERVKGASAHPMFLWLAAQGAVPTWNFNKFLIDADGKFVQHFKSGTRPNSTKLVTKIEEILPVAH